MVKTEPTIKNEKLRMDLLSPYALKDMAQGMHAGLIQGYTAWDWVTSTTYEMNLAALLRHITEMMEGKEKDKQSGLHPICHILARAMMISHQLHLQVCKETISGSVTFDSGLSGEDLETYLYEENAWLTRKNI